MESKKIDFEDCLEKFTEEGICDWCGGSGKVPKMEQVWPGEAPEADIGSEPCPVCHLQPEEDSDSYKDNLEER